MIPLNTCLTRYARLDALLSGAVGSDWLRGDELLEFDRIHDASRRQQWLAGRLLSRALLVETFSIDSGCHLQVLSRDDRNLGVSPRVLLDGREVDCGLSIAHSQRGVLVAVSQPRSAFVGVDLCDAIPVTAGFLRLWFTATEQHWIQADSYRAATAWAGKEAVYKAMGQGAAWNPREIEVLPAAKGGYQCRYQGRRLDTLTLEVCELDDHVAAIAVGTRDVKVSIELYPCDGVVVLCGSSDFNPERGSSHD